MHYFSGGRTMKIPSWVVFVMTLLMLAGCSTYSVVTDYDSSFPFGSYKTYHWADDGIAKSSNNVLANNPLILRRIKSTIDKEFAIKGFMLNNDGPVDFTLSVYAGVQDRESYSPPPINFSFYHGYHHNRFGHQRFGYYRPGYNWFGVYDPYWPGPYVSYYQEGTLVIDVTDEKSGELAWRGVAQGVLKNYDSSKEMQQDIDAAIAKILVKFPPLK